MILSSRDLTVTIDDTLAGCPYYRRMDSGKCDGRASCSYAGEPLCITDEPLAGWESETFEQHNRPNPILVAVRVSGIDVAEWGAAVFSTEIYGGLRAWEDEAHPFHVLTKATDDELDHADRVLGRLVRAAWEVSS